MTRIIIFAKAPLAGFAKTRLIPALGPEGAAKLAHRMLKHALSCAAEAATGPIELRVTPEINAPAWLDTEIAQGVTITNQGDGDLGERLARAAQHPLERGESVLLIGTDCVDMSAMLLCDAAAALKLKDAVIYPAADGGYVLLGLAKFHPHLFCNISWSTESVARETIERVHRLGWSLEVGPLLHDIDGPGDLQHVPEGWLY